ncbi:MAG: TonB-dependent receptor [Chitinophagaceae bacterium]|nr:TonB-dependent receptor [Chitinophagaceae bacterium]
MDQLLWVSYYAKKHGSVLCLIMMLWSLTGRAQHTNASVSYEASDIKVETVLKEIGRQTSFSLTYNQDEISDIVIRHVSWKHTPVQEALQELQHKYGLSYSIAGDNIALKRVSVRTVAKTAVMGKVTGRITDEESGEALSGVTVKVGNSYVTSAIDGSFSVSLPKGKYTAVITSVGYGAKNVSAIEVNEGQVYELNIALKKERGTLKGVVVTTDARRETVAALYTRQKNSAVISDGISAEQISRMPDRNAGESLKRVTGVSTLDNRFTVVRGLSERYNGAMLNGQLMPSTELNRKNFSFDIIPTSIVENITVVKTLTPDRSAEFGGGLVEINTIDIPTRNFLTVSAGGGWNDNTAGKPFLSMRLEGREYLGSVSKHRYLFGSLDWKTGYDAARYYSQHGDNPSLFNNNWGITSMKPQPNQNYQLSFGRALKVKGGELGIVASAGYRNNFGRVDVRTGREGWAGSGSALLGAKAERYDFSTNLGGMIGVGYRKGNHRLSLRSIWLRTLNQQLTTVYDGSGPDAKGNWGMYDITTQSTLLQTQLKGEHQLNKRGLKVNWMGSYIYLNKLRPDNHILLTFADSNALAVDNNNVNIAHPSNIFDFNRWWSRALEKNYSWDASVSVPFQLAGSKQVFKGGYAGWSKDRLFFVLNGLVGTTAGANDFYIPLTAAYGPDYLNMGGFSKWGDSMHKSQTLHALYGMLDNRLGTRWRLVWGLRAEHVDMSRINGVLEHLESTGVGDYTNWRRREKNWQFFPSANLTYSLTPQMNLRLAYARSIVRPDLRELAYFHEYDYELGGEYGGAAVRSTLIDHYDIRYEWYPSLGDVISVTGFYKDLHYPMEVFQEPNRLFQLKNSKEARNYGVEMEIRKSLSFTNVPVIRNITLYGNFTYLDARVRPMDIIATSDPNHPGRTYPKEVVYDWEKRPQAGASNYIFNAGIYYDSRFFSVSAMYNSLTNRLVRVMDRVGSLSASSRSFYERPAKSLDVQVAFHLLDRRLDIKLNAANLLNSSYIVYCNYDSPDKDGNLTKGQLEYKEGSDLLDYKATGGRTYSFTLTYSFK